MKHMYVVGLILVFSFSGCSKDSPTPTKVITPSSGDEAKPFSTTEPKERNSHDDQAGSANVPPVSTAEPKDYPLSVTQSKDVWEILNLKNRYGDYTEEGTLRILCHRKTMAKQFQCSISSIEHNTTMFLNPVIFSDILDKTLILSADGLSGSADIQVKCVVNGYPECSVLHLVEPAPEDRSDFYKKISSISAGADHTCAIADGKAYCWGLGRNGETDVPEELKNPVAVSAQANGLSCAVEGNSVLCWGWRGSDSINVRRYSFNNLREFSSGSNRRCVIDNNGISCWGRPSSEAELIVPKNKLRNPRSLSVGSSSGTPCFINAGFVECNSNLPVMNNPQQLSMGDGYGCAIDDQKLKCWGHLITYRGSSLQPPKSIKNPKKVFTGAHHACVIDDEGVKCWGDNDFGQLDVPPLKNLRELSVGDEHTCALDDEGIKCWGSNRYDESRIPKYLR